MPDADRGLQDKTELRQRMDTFLARSQEPGVPYTTVVLGKEFLMLPTVFSPRYYHETAFFTEQVVRLLRADEAYLDLGCGVGVTAVFAALHGARVTALDINPAAVENTTVNVERHQVGERVTVAQSDVYSALSPGQQFDTIYWNAPFAYRAEGTSLTALEEAIYDPGYRKNREFIDGAHQHLNPGGQLLLGMSSTLGDVDAVNAFAAEADLHFMQIAELIVTGAPYEIRMQLLQARV